jgi:hypothetical protein
MKQYLLAVHGDDSEGAERPSPEEMQKAFKAVDELNAELQATGAWVFGGGLQPSSSATVVSAKNGDVVTTDGPFTETKEQLGGFWIVNAEDLDAALALAAKGSEACGGPVEVRPFQDEPEA